jgi:hypothetical protein
VDLEEDLINALTKLKKEKKKKNNLKKKTTS